MTELSYARAEFYRHSGRIDAGRLLVGMAGALAVCVALELLYSVLRVYVHIASILSLLFFAGNCLGVGATALFIIRWAKVRNTPIGLLAALMIGCFAVAATWVTWVWLILNRSQIDVTPAELVLHPLITLDFIVRINHVGTWTLGHDKNAFSGFPLWVVWAVEAGAITVAPVLMVQRFLRKTPFCEQCVKWGSSRVLANVMPADNKMMREKMMQKDFAYLQSLGDSKASMDWFRICMEGCTGCASAPLLTVERVKVTVNNKGHRSEKVTAVVRHLILNGEESTTLIMACASVEAGGEVG